jgi:hypothetical protein
MYAHIVAPPDSVASETVLGGECERSVRRSTEVSEVKRGSDQQGRFSGAAISGGGQRGGV